MRQNKYPVIQNTYRQYNRDSFLFTLAPRWPVGPGGPGIPGGPCCPGGPGLPMTSLTDGDGAMVESVDKCQLEELLVKKRKQCS